MSDLKYDRTVVYNVGYHMVWSVKYRRKVLLGYIREELSSILNTIAIEKGFEIKEYEIMPDHVHVFVSAKPKFSPSYIYKMLKGISARRMFIRHPGLKRQLWSGLLWNPSTYVETIGHISEDAVKKYIQDQMCRE